MSKETMKMSAATKSIPAILIATFLLGVFAVVPAAAAPTWSVGIGHQNLYGVGGLVSPYSGSGESFARKSGGNAYSVQVTNSSLGIGANLTCEAGTWTGATSFAYQWYRNGTVIIGATSSTYTTEVADSGKAVQCAVTGSNAGPGAFVRFTRPRLVGTQAAPLGLPRAGEEVPTSVVEGIRISASNGGNVGSTLTCIPDFGWRWPSFSYQWLKNGSPIADATSKSYVVQAADAPAAIQCAVTGSNAAGAVTVASPAITTNPAPSPAAPSSIVTTGPKIVGGPSANVAGGAQVGQVLTCNGGPATATLSYQWLRNNVPIAGQTSLTYTLAAADQGAQLQCQVAANNGEAVMLKASIPLVVSPPPAVTPPTPPAAGPTVTGTANVGQTLTCATGSWTPSSPAPTLAFQWLHNGIAISGATGSTYVVNISDLGTDIQCQVSGETAGGKALQQSAARLIAALPPSASVAPAISGTPLSVGTTLTCNNGTWANGPAFGYEWLRNGSPIVGAVSQAYTVVSEDEGKALQCRVTATNSQSVVQAVSANAVISPSPLVTPPTLKTVGTVTGTTAVGEELICNVGEWENGPVLNRQWLRNGMPISGATAEKYRLAGADLGKSIQCQVGAANAGGTSIAINATSSSVKYVNPIVPAATAVLQAPVSVSVGIALPAGMELVGGKPTQESLDDSIFFNPGPRAGGVSESAMIYAAGWSCSVITLTCTRSDALAAGESYPPIVLHVRPGDKTPDLASPTVSVFGGGASSTVATDPTSIVAAVPFGLTSFLVSTEEEDNAPSHNAGGHPFSAMTEAKQNVSPSSDGSLVGAGGDIKAVQAKLPPGFSANLQNFPQCSAAVASSLGVGHPNCSLSTAVGYIDVSFPDGFHTKVANGYFYRGGFPIGLTGALYNVEPEPGLPAQFSFRIEDNPYVLDAKLRSDGDYGITVGATQVPANPGINAFKVTICANGVEEGPKTSENLATLKCKPTAATNRTFINNPQSCAGGAPLTSLRFSSYNRPEEFLESSAYSGGPSGPISSPENPNSKGSPVPSSSIIECQQDTEKFHPSFNFQQEGEAGEAPTGAMADLAMPQTNEQQELATPALKKTVAVLPEGLTLNAAAANGLGACTEQEIGLANKIDSSTGLPELEPMPNPIRFDQSANRCPNSSKIGTVEAETPLLAKHDANGSVIEAGGKTVNEVLFGNLYLAEQKANPFGTNFALYLTIEDPEKGIVVKLPGKVQADPGSGRLTATFDYNPQLPVEHVRLHFFNGPQASLATPNICGSHTTTTQISPWSAADPDNPTPAEISTPSSSFQIKSNCADSVAHLPFSLGMSAGSNSVQAGAVTPFNFRITRPDGAQELSTLTLSPPAGLTAYLGGVPRCSDAQIKAAEGKSGKAEQANPSCPSGSQVGTTLVGAGAGSNPYYAGGKLYLAGPYKGAPLSIVAITPAVAGPFDLGDVVVRSAIFVDPRTARITAKTDPLPHILEGVPLRIRDLRVNLDRSHWTLNPTNCSPMSVDATVTGTGGATTNLSNRFQVGGCDKLAFKPNLKIQLHGGTKRAAYQRLQATVTYPEGAGYANIARTAVTLPHSVFLAQEHIRTVCTRVQFAAHACPPGSIYGRAIAVTPLLDQPLTGPVYLRSSDNKLPDMVAALRGPDSTPIEVELDGRVDSIHGGLRTTFDVVPDAPVSKFTLELFGGKKSLAVNSRNLCKGPKQRATARFTAQNGMQRNFRPVVANDCGKKRKPAGKKKAARLQIPGWQF